MILASVKVVKECPDAVKPSSPFLSFIYVLLKIVRREETHMVILFLLIPLIPVNSGAGMKRRLSRMLLNECPAYIL